MATPTTPPLQPLHLNFYDQISSNRYKTILIFLLFFAMIAILGAGYGIYIGDILIGILIAVVIGALYCPIAYLAGDSMILTLSSAQPAAKQKYPHLINTIEGLSIAAGIPMPRVFVIDDTAINAFATGRNPKNAAITVTTGAIDRLNRAELEGVIGHEMSHIKNYDIRVMMLAAVMVGLIALLSDFFLRSVLYGRRSNNSESKSGNLELVLVIVGIFLALLSPIIAQFVQLAVSRRREFLADASGAMLTRYPPGLASALRKIRDDKEPIVEAANKATAHLYIENPLRRYHGFVSKLFATHPDINERIRKLEAM